MELRDEQPPVREDQDAERARRFDEAGGGDRLARRGRMAEAVAPGRTRILADVLLRELQLFRQLDAEVVLFLLFDLRLGGGLALAVAVAVQLRLDLRCRDQLGQHPRERVDLVPAQLGARGEAGRTLAEHALEPEHERVADLPAVGRLLRAGLQLGERVVERPAAGGAFRERFGWVFVRVEKRFSCPGFCTECGGAEAVRSLRS